SLTDKYHLKKAPEPEKATNSGIEESLPSVSDLESTIDISVIELATYTASTDSEADDVHLRENLGLLKRKIEMIGKTKRKYKAKAQSESGANREVPTKPGSAKKGRRAVDGSGTTTNRSTIRKVSSGRERESGKETNTGRSTIKPSIPRSGVVRRLQTLKTLQQIEYEKKVMEEFLIKIDNVIKMVKEGFHVGKQEVEDLNQILHRIEHSKSAMEQIAHEDVKKKEEQQSKCEGGDKAEKELTLQEKLVKYDEREIKNIDKLAGKKDADVDDREEEERKIAVEIQLNEEWNNEEEKQNKIKQKENELFMLEKLTDLSSGQYDHRQRQDEIRMMVDGDSIKKKNVEEEERIKREKEAEEERIRLEKEAQEIRLRQEREEEEKRLQQERAEERRLKQLREEEERRRQLLREEEERRLKMEKDLKEKQMEEERNKVNKEERKRKREAILAKINVERKHWKEKILHDGMEDAEMSERTQFILIRGPNELLKSSSLTSSVANEAPVGSSGSPFELQEKMASQFVEIRTEERTECGAQVFVEAVKIHNESTTVVKVSVDGGKWEERPALNHTVTTGDRQTKHLVGAEFTDFQNLSMVVAARNKTENVLIKDKEITIKSKVDSNIRVTIPAKSFDEAETNVRLSVQKMLDTDLEKAKVLHQGCHNIISTSPIVSLNCQNKCKKCLAFRFAKLAGDTSKTKQIGVVWCDGEKWEIAGESNEIVPNVNHNDYCCFLIRTAKDLNSQNILTAAQQFLFHSTETLSQILCVQKTTDPSTLRVECVPVEKVSSRIAELEQNGYSMNPNVSQEVCVKDGENIAIKCTDNIKMDPPLNGEKLTQTPKTVDLEAKEESKQKKREHKHEKEAANKPVQKADEISADMDGKKVPKNT
ncbi:hypothetical protein CHS0354_013008, partial [Potamilus streckersoni]